MSHRGVRGERAPRIAFFRFGRLPLDLPPQELVEMAPLVSHNLYLTYHHHFYVLVYKKCNLIFQCRFLRSFAFLVTRCATVLGTV